MAAFAILAMFFYLHIIPASKYDFHLNSGMESIVLNSGSVESEEAQTRTNV